MWLRFIEFFSFFAASVAGAIFYFSPQLNPRWRPALKYLMSALVMVVAVSELLVRDLTGKGWEDRAAHLAGYAFCTVFSQYPRCYDRTIAEFSGAIREDPRNPTILVARGEAYFGHGDYDRAIDDFSEAVRLDPTFAAAFARRAYAHRAKGENDRAAADIQLASKLDPQFASAATDMMRTLSALALKQEIEYSRTALSPTAAAPDRDEVVALRTRARTYLSVGDVMAARLVLRRAAERDDAQAALALGGTYDPAVLKRLGVTTFHSDPTQARDWYRRAAELGSADASLRLEQLAQEVPQRGKGRPR